MAKEKAKANTGDETHDIILDELRDIASSVEDLKDKMFVGNGSPSLASQINKNTMVSRVITWAIAVIYIAIIGAIVSGKITISTASGAETNAVTVIAPSSTNGVPCLY